MARYRFTASFESHFKAICNGSHSMGQAALELKMNYKTTVRFHAKRLDCFKPNQAGRKISKQTGRAVISLQEIFNGKHSTYQSHKLKRRLLHEGFKKHACEQCALTEWQGRQIPLELHHVDGNRYNNSFSNLELLCPNCHALTSNYRAKNINNLSAPAEMREAEPLKIGEALPRYHATGNPEPSLPSSFEWKKGVET